VRRQVNGKMAKYSAYSAYSVRLEYQPLDRPAYATRRICQSRAAIQNQLIAA
jgi:hypothetical protein